MEVVRWFDVEHEAASKGHTDDFLEEAEDNRMTQLGTDDRTVELGVV